jgi:hypothetical protein
VTPFQECVCLVFARLGLGPTPPKYLDDIESVQRAASEWHRLPEHERDGFPEFALPDLLSGALQTGNLDDAERFGWTRNEAARRFVRYVDKHSGCRGTLLMLQVIMLLQQIISETSGTPEVNARGGGS